MKWQTRKARAGSDDDDDENNGEGREVIEGGFCIQISSPRYVCATYFLNSINTFMISIILLYTTRIHIHRLGVGLFVLVCD